MKTLVFKVALKEEEDGRWSASIPALPGCASWGYSPQEALGNVKDAAEIYKKDFLSELHAPSKAGGEICLISILK